LPAGFKKVEGFALPWDLDEMPVLQGTWGKVRTITVKRGKKMEEQRVCDVETADGKRYNVWESALLRPLFDDADEGTDVYIAFEGYGKAKAGQNAPKLFTVATRD
jgi:hypothetical protein